MGKSGESRGEVLRGELLVEWNEARRCFHVMNRWVVRDARGELVELIDQGQVRRLEDDEFLDRNLTRLVRACAAEARAYVEERRDGVQRLL